MTDGVNVDFGLLKQPNYLDNYTTAFQVGRRMVAPPASPAPAAPPPASAIAGLSRAAQASAAQQAEILGALSAGLAGAPYGERRAMLAHLTPALVGRGVPASAIAAFDPTDDALAAIGRQAREAQISLSEDPADA